MSLGLSEITVAKLASDVLGGSRGEAVQRIKTLEFSDKTRAMQKLDEPGEVKASEAISYEELNRIWDRILPNAYEIIKTPEQPAFASRREIT